MASSRVLWAEVVGCVCKSRTKLQLMNPTPRREIAPPMIANDGVYECDRFKIICVQIHDAIRKRKVRIAVIATNYAAAACCHARSSYLRRGWSFGAHLKY